MEQARPKYRCGNSIPPALLFLLPPHRRRRSDSPPGLRFDLAKHSREFAESITKRLLYGSHFSSFYNRGRIEFRVSIPWKDLKFSKRFFLHLEKNREFFGIFFKFALIILLLYCSQLASQLNCACLKCIIL